MKLWSICGASNLFTLFMFHQHDHPSSNFDVLFMASVTHQGFTKNWPIWVTPPPRIEHLFIASPADSLSTGTPRESGFSHESTRTATYVWVSLSRIVQVVLVPLPRS